MSQDATDKNDALPVEQRRQGQSAFIRFAVTLSIFGNCTQGTIGQLFVLAMGATPFHIAMLSSLTRLAPLAQLAGLRLIGRTGKIRLLGVGTALMGIPLLFLVILAAGGWYGTAAVLAGIIAYTALSFTGSGGNTAWWPLLQDLTAGEPKGLFFARMRTRLRAVELIIPLLVGAYLGRSSTPKRFLLPFAVGLATALTASWLLRRVPERQIASGQTPLLTRLRLASRVPSVRSYLLLMAQYSFTAALFGPFMVLMLRHHGLPDGWIVWMDAITAIGNVAGINMWARTVDRHGGRHAISITLVGMSLLGLGWLLMPTGLAGMAAWGVAFYVLWGFFQGGFLMGRTPVMLEAIPVRYQADGFALINFAAAAGGALGSFAGGGAFEWLTRHAVKLGPLDGRMIYMAAAQLLFLALWPAKRRLSDHDQQTAARFLIAVAWKRIVRRLGLAKQGTPPSSSS
jgi:hypothetical protein